MTVQFFKTPAGEEIAILPRSEFEDLIQRAAAAEADEHALDIAMYDARKAELFTGGGCRKHASRR